jgi:hypothetical protein
LPSMSAADVVAQVGRHDPKPKFGVTALPGTAVAIWPMQSAAARGVFSFSARLLFRRCPNGLGFRTHPIKRAVGQGCFTDRGGSRNVMQLLPWRSER